MGPVATAEGRRFTDWMRTGVATAAAQGMVQGLGFLSSLIIVRSLDPREYAIYTITAAGLGTMTVLTDSGVGNSVLALGGTVWRDPLRLGAVIATGIRLRRRFSLMALAAGIPLMLVLMRVQGVSWSESALAAASIVPVFLATVTNHMFESVPRLHQRLAPMQALQVIANLGRLLAVAGVVTLWPLAALANAVTAVPQWWANLRLRRLAAGMADWRQPADPQIEERISAQVRRATPGVLYYAFSGQLSVWLIAIFGKSSAVAAVGAVGRLAMVMNVLGTAFSILALPRFARIPAEDGLRVRSRYVQAQLLLAAASCLPLGLLVLFPGPTLALLGPHYSGLQYEALLMGLNGMATVVCGAAYGLGASRGIIASPALTLPTSLLLQVLLILALPLNTAAGVIWVGILSAVGQWLVHVGYFRWRCR